MAADGISKAQLHEKASKPLTPKNARKSGEGKPKVRRRTKSGCLTCRKRRIKCDECRPICNNCIKSKRECEGYNPRVGIRDPQGAIESLGSNYNIASPATNGAFVPSTSFANPATTVPLTPIRPRLVPGSVSVSSPDFSTLSPGHQTSAANATKVDPREIYPNYHHFPPDILPVNIPNDFPTGVWNVNTLTSYSKPKLQSELLSSAHQVPSSGHSLQQRSLAEAELARWTNPFNSPAIIKDNYNSPIGQQSWSSDHSSPSSNAHGERASTKSSNITDGNHLAEPDTQFSVPSISFQHVQPETFDRSNAHPSPISHSNSSASFITQTLEAAAIEVQDDDYHDVFSDEEEEILSVNSSSQSKMASVDFVPSVSVHKESTGNGFSLNGFADQGIVDTYRVERVANPLRNIHTARIFAHFITSTGPMLSLHERPFFTDYTMTERGSVPISCKNTWTHTLPMMALHNQSLLHAMLAVSSLHIARLQGAPATPSLKHYAYSLKRVHHAVCHERKRHEVTTLAATLLLGFYEIMTAEHAKWSTHLHGATQLIKEIDYATITEEMIIHNARNRIREQGTYDLAYGGLRDSNFLHIAPAAKSKRLPLVDMQIVDLLTGQPSSPRLHNLNLMLPIRNLTDTEVCHHEVLQDLNWWYRRHDVYHSLISGNKLLMEYNRWSECPPRAQLGDYSAIHGSFDHLILLFGRLATFIVTDRARKLRVLAARGGAWRTPPGPPVTPNIPTSSQTLSSAVVGSKLLPHDGVPVSGEINMVQNSSIGGNMHNTAPSYGMAPFTGTPHMPRVFQTKRPPPAFQSPPRLDEEDLVTATHKAEGEWNEINAAFKLFADSLGPEFQLQNDEACRPMPTPFGPSLTYRNHDIANIWLHYNTGLIITLRSHPSMPPAAQIAVGVAASQTAELANQVGRIAAGLLQSSLIQEVNPALESFLPGGVIPLFFAGVQYQDAAQREWTINRLREIEYRTGWASAGLCANGCETSWVKAAQLGRGPSYEPVCGNTRSTDQRVSGRFSHLSGEPPTDPMDRRFVPFNQDARLVWASGLLGTEEDFSRMSLK